MDVSECTLTHVEVEGASDTNGSVNEYQRSRQFKLRAVLLKPTVCEDVNLLVTTTVEWSATLQQTSAVPPSVTVVNGSAVNGSAVNGSAGGSGVQFPTNTKEVVIPSNTLAYGRHAINVVVVSQCVCVCCIVYSLFCTKCSQDRNTVYKTQKIDTQTKGKKHKNTSKHAIHIHTLKIYKASLRTLKQVINENIL